MCGETIKESEGEQIQGPEACLEAVLSRRERRRTETRERLLDAALRLLSERDFDSVTVEMITEAAEVGKGTFFNYFASKEAIVAYLFESRLRLLAEILAAEEEGKRSADTVPESRRATDVTGHTDAGPSSSRSAIAFPVSDKRREEDSRVLSVSSVSSSASVVQTGGESSIAKGKDQDAGPLWRRIVGITHLMVELDGTSKRLQRTLLSLALTNDAVRAASVGKRARVIAVGGELVRAAQAGGELRDDLPAEALTDYLINAYFNALYVWSLSESEESLHAVIERMYALVWEGVRPPEKGQE